jgi:hypothetical protein
MPDRERERVRRVKRGEVPVLSDVLREIEDVQAAVRNLLAAGRTPLPAEPELDAVSEWSTGAHRRHWGWA